MISGVSDVQGHMFACWHFMLIYGTNVFLTQNFLLNNKNFGANFSENVYYAFFTYTYPSHIFAEQAEMLK